MHYLITDGKRYISYDEEAKRNIIVDSYKKASKLKYNETNAIYNKLESDIMETGEWQIIGATEAKYDLTDAWEINIDAIMDSLETNLSLLVRRKKVLELELLEVEREIIDIYHAIEFYEANSEKAYSIYRLMHDKLIKRRGIKDESVKIDYILTGGIKGLTSRQTRKRFEDMENRTYLPRALKELFEM